MSSAENKTQEYILRLAPKDEHMRACYSDWITLLELQKELRKQLPNVSDFALANGTLTSGQTKQVWMQIKGKPPADFFVSYPNLLYPSGSPGGQSSTSSGSFTTPLKTAPKLTIRSSIS
jgi:hypothetical protein